jgi:regulatory protein
MGLVEGGEVAPEATEALERSDVGRSAREAALRLLAVRARSEGELDDRLRRKGYDERTSAEVVARLKSVGLVDDEEFARAWIDEKLRLRPCGPRRLVQELLTRRVPRGLAERVVGETFRDHDEVEVARRALASKARSTQRLDPAKRRARLQSFLLRRGFSYEVTSTVVRELTSESGGESDV